MASLRATLILLLFLAVFLLSSPVNCDSEEDVLISLNSHRAFLDLPIFMENDEADCLADEVAKKLEDQPCTKKDTTSFDLNQDSNLISKCDIDFNHTKDGVVLPVCVPDLDSIEVFTNYTKTYFAKYINDSKFSQAGIGSEGDWMVVVLGTNTTEGDFAQAAAANSLVSIVGFGHCLASFFLGIFVYLVY